MNGADDLLAAFCEAAGVDREDAGHGGASSADGEFFVSGFECLGACDIAPMASIDERYYGPLDAERRRSRRSRRFARATSRCRKAARQARGGRRPRAAAEPTAAR